MDIRLATVREIGVVAALVTRACGDYVERSGRRPPRWMTTTPPRWPGRRSRAIQIVCQTMSVKAFTDARLRTLLVSGELPPNARLSELALAGRLGVSRPTVREALRKLESIGLAVSDGRSLRVAQMPDSELRSALLMRSSLEALHAELAAIRVAAGDVAPAALRRLHELANTTQRETEFGDRGRAVLLNRRFHQSIDALAQSPVSATAVDRLWDQIMVSTERSLIGQGRDAEVGRDHEALLIAIEDGEPIRAAAIASRHVRATLQVLG